MKLGAILFFPLRLLNQVLGILCGEASWFFNARETRIIEAAAAGLDEESRAIFGRQLQHWLFVQRQNKAQVTGIFFQFPDSVPALDVPEDYQLAKLKLRSARGSLTASVELYKGQLCQINYSKPPKPILSVPFEIVSAEYGRTPDHEVERQLDWEEHGDDADWPDPTKGG